MGRQTQERAANIAQAAEAVAAAAVANHGNQGQGQGQAQGPVNVNRQMPQLVEQFLKLKPSKFDGKGDHEAASLWVEELEKAFEVLGCTEEEKVTLAVYQFQGNASDWRKATRGRVFLAGATQTWAMFVEVFNGKYFSESARERKLAEFMRLRQGQMSVDQYEVEFSRLSKFAPRMVEDPLDKARRFRVEFPIDEQYTWIKHTSEIQVDVGVPEWQTHTYTAWTFRDGAKEFGPARGFDAPYNAFGDWDPFTVPPLDGELTSTGPGPA
ncbi:uncharacterized protein LOC130134844 [Syzygium oleosum]|uniref:uncharacterized protein LOC130134844 n=1 Tax=Syzygium oleosum TaxID=219896 RepID=UPI0024BAC35A|nr:uncharacterized protein LOC130134844 [Syzygium oleosum]